MACTKIEPVNLKRFECLYLIMIKLNRVVYQSARTMRNSGRMVSKELLKNVLFAFLTGSYDKIIGYLAAICISIAIVIFLRSNKTRM